MRRQTVAAALAGFAALTFGMVGFGQQQPPAGPQDDLPAIRLKAATFVPTRGERPAIPPGLSIAAYAQGQRGYYLVQFRGPVLDEWKNELAGLGVDLLDYVPEFAFKVRMTPAQAAQAAMQPNVAWIGLFHPAFKMSPNLARNGLRLYVIQIERGGDVDAAVAEIAAAGVQVTERNGDVLTVAASGAQVNAIAHVLDVASIEEFRMREKHNDHAAGRILGGADANYAGYDGSSQIVAIADTGLGNGLTSDSHNALAGRVLSLFNWPGTNNTCYTVTNDGAVDVDSGHGTHVALSAVGSGAGIGRGAAPAARLIFQAVENWAQMQGFCALVYPSGYYLTGIPADVRQLFQQAYDFGAKIHSNSWGSDAAGDYTLDSANADNFVWTNRDMTITFSAGNAGTDANSDGVIDNDSMGSPATAKNVITVGASENDRLGDWACDTALSYAGCGGSNSIFTYGFGWPADFPGNPIKDDPSAGNAEQMAAFSSRGPTDDGRIKPDVVAPGTWILSGYSDKYQEGIDPSANPKNGLWQYDGWGAPRSQYLKYMGGTSMSNPIVAGGAAVVRDYYWKARTHEASAALVKADLINSAVDLLDENNDGVNDNDFPIPNNHEGWGRVNLAEAVQAHEFVESTSGLGTGGNASFSYSAPGGAPFKVTLVWTDYPSTETALKNLVNDLDLVVTSPTGAIHRGNVFAGGWSLAGGSADRVNNVENVYIQSAASGTWTVEVNGFNVPNGPQPFALVVRGGSTGGGMPSNTAPNAANAAIATNEDTSVAISLSGSDAEQCELQFSIVSGPSQGSVGAITDNSCTSGSPNQDTATITYTPNSNFSGSDSFTYRVGDGSLTSGNATATITVNAVNDAPVAANTSATTTSGTAIAVTLRATDVDGCDAALGFSIVASPASGVVGVPSGVTCSAGTHTAQVTYTPNSGFSGSDSFTYKARDGAGVDSNTATASIVVNAVPAGVTVTGINPNNVRQNVGVRDFVITGNGFAMGAAVAFENGSGPAPRVRSVTYNGSTQLTATVEIRSGGPARNRVWDVRVTNPNGSTGVGQGLLTITP